MIDDIFSAREIMNNFLDHLPSNYILDQSRQVFLKEQTETIAYLMDGKLEGQNRFRRLLLGSNAVDKSTLLKCISYAANSVYGDKLLSVYVSYSDTKERLASCICQHLRRVGVGLDMDEYLTDACVIHSTKTVNAIRDAEVDVYDLLLKNEADLIELGIPAGMARRISSTASSPPLFTRLSNALQSSDKRMLVIVDELQNIYTSSDFSCGESIRDILAIGNDQNGFIHCIISGSTDLQLLAFAKLPVTKETKDQFPNYRSIDLNSTKFQTCWIQPLL